MCKVNMEHSRLAVTAPRSIELNQDILLIIQNDVIVIPGNNNGYWAILRLWDRLRLDRGIDFASNEIIDERANRLLGELSLLVEGKLLVLDGLLNSERGPLADLKVEVATVLTEGLGV